MKKTKNWIIYIVCFALIAGALAVLSIGEDDGTEKKDKDDTVNTGDPVDSGEDTTDTSEDTTDTSVTINLCTCSICAENLDFGIYAVGESSWSEDSKLSGPFSIGDTVQFAVMGRNTYYSKIAFNDEVSSTCMGGLLTEDITFDCNNYYVWDSECANAASAASVASFGLRETTTATNLAASLGAEATEGNDADPDWTPYY